MAAVVQQSLTLFLFFILLASAQRMKSRTLGNKERRERMKEWAAHLYLSKAWEDTRAAYLLSQQCICERCGEPAKIVHHKVWLTRDNINDLYIALGWNNLEALCQDCHNKEHHKQNKKQRYYFDADGNVTQSPPSKK